MSTATANVVMLPISTVRASNVPAKMLEVYTSARATVDKATGKKKEISAAHRTRSILVPEFLIEGVPGKFEDFIRSQLASVAKQQLSALWEETPSISETPAELWTTDSLLVYAARNSETQRLSCERIRAAFAGFVNSEAIAEEFRGKASIQEVLESASASGFKAGEKQVTMLLSWIEAWLELRSKEDDEFAETWEHRAVLRKLTTRRDELAAMKDSF